MIDLHQTRIQHIHWSEQVQQALRKGRIPQVSDSKSCEFGKWLAHNGRTKYAHMSEIFELELKHEEFHHTVSEMLKYLELKDYDQAAILLGEFRRDSKDLIYLLTMLEYRLSLQ